MSRERNRFYLFLLHRVKKVRAKRRAMAGLPPEEENSDDELDDKAADYDSDEDDKPLDINKSVMDGLKLFRSKADETTERQLNADRRVAGSHRRDWDDDKEVTWMNLADFLLIINTFFHAGSTRR